MANAKAEMALTATNAGPSDADNVYITLSVREKNPKAYIHARGDSEAGLRRLRLAGADRTLSAYEWGGMRVAASILRPSVVDFLELSVPGRESEIDLEEIKIEALKSSTVRFGEISIVYTSRLGEIKLNPWRDGLQNLWFLVKKRFT